MASGKNYTWLNSPIWIIAVIFALIPVCNWICGILERVKRGNLIGIIVFIFFGWFLGFCDLITILLNNQVQILA